MKWLGDYLIMHLSCFVLFVCLFVLRKKGQGGVIQGSTTVVCITEIYGIAGSSNYFPLKTTIFCHLLKYLQP